MHFFCLSGGMGVGLPLLFVFLWSTGFVVAALVAPYSEPLSILTLRFGGAAIVLLLFGWLSRGVWPNKERALKIIASGALIHGVYLSAVFWGVKNGMPAGVSALLVGLQPLLTAIFASPILGETIKPRHWLGLLIGIVGCALVISPKLGLDGSGINAITVGAHMIAVLGITFGSIFQKKYVGAMNFKTEPGLQLIGGLLVALPIALMSESFNFIFARDLIVGYAWMTLILSCIAFTLYMYLLQQGGATKVASVFYLVPVFSAVEGYYLFGDMLTPIQVIGMIVTAAAVALASDIFARKKIKQKAKASGG